MIKKNYKWSLAQKSIALVMAIVIFSSSNIHWGGHHPQYILQGDAKGYYAYLPAIFIYNDLNFGFFDYIEKQKYYDKDIFYDYRSTFRDKTINKYFAGTALLEMPFFFAAHVISVFTSQDTDGYADLYLIFINVAALFYLFAGLLFLDKLLKAFDIKEMTRAIVIFSGVFGTNLFYYSVVEPGLSHVFSFGMITMFLYFGKKYFDRFSSSKAILMAMLLGVITLIRPSNLLVVFILPFLAGTFQRFKEGMSFLIRNLSNTLLAVLIFTAIIGIQSVIYKMSTGNFLVYSYGKEGFDFFNPHMIDILFSYKKGLFVYTPLYLISLFGLYFMGKKSIYKALTIGGFLWLFTYVVSSWWMWYYGGSFSSRVYVEYIPLFMILLAHTIDQLKGIKKKLFLSFVFLLIVLCQIQTYQYRRFIIHWEDMTKEKYWEVFLKIK